MMHHQQEQNEYVERTDEGNPYSRIHGANDHNQSTHLSDDHEWASIRVTYIMQLWSVSYLIEKKTVQEKFRNM